MIIVFSEKCLNYWEPGHPESPQRVYTVYELLKEKNFQFSQAEMCAEKDLMLTHDKTFVKKIKNRSFHDSDSANLPDIYDYARLSAGAAIQSTNLAIKGEKAFSLMRPPGHHAGTRGRALGASSLGFCYFNNIAIACKKALGRVRKVAIIDIDCHHGNGTQEIFFGESRVLYASIHRYGDVYPGTGARSEENCLNFPLRPDLKDSEYLQTLASALEEIEKFSPDLIGVSAGFDAHMGDPVCGLGLSVRTYHEIGVRISELGCRTFAVLEGGYGKEMPECVYNFLIGLEDRKP